MHYVYILNTYLLDHIMVFHSFGAWDTNYITIHMHYVYTLSVSQLPGNSEFMSLSDKMDTPHVPSCNLLAFLQRL